MMTKKITVLFLLSFLLSSQTLFAQQYSCYDVCSTGCVQRDTRLMSRCDRKCSIKCGPDRAAADKMGIIGG